MANLYEIQDEILNCIDMETGEIIDIDKFDNLRLERDTKIENIGLWIKNLRSEAEAYKTEKDSFAERQKRAENKAESLKRYLSSVLEGKKFSTSRLDISFRKSTRVEIDESQLPANFLQEVVSYKIDKSDIGKKLKAGETIKGAELVESQNIQIK